MLIRYVRFASLVLLAPATASLADDVKTQPMTGGPRESSSRLTTRASRCCPVV